MSRGLGDVYKRQALVLLLLASCGDSDGDTQSTPNSDASILVDANPALPDAAPFSPGPTPTGALPPKVGELSFWQLELPPGITQRLGEASIIVGPEGSIALLDIGNSTHDDEVRDAVRELNTQWLTPANGFAARDPLQVEWIIITHVHGDHVGSFQNLLMSGDSLTGLKGIVHRGFVDLGEGMNTNDFEEFCAGMGSTYASIDKPLCAGPSQAGCSYASLPNPNVAANCDGLSSGDLATTEDDAAGDAAFIDLDGAIITIVGANGYFNNGTSLVPIASFGHDTGDEENGRSLAGVISYGEFRYHFGGDLHGRASDGPDVESHLVATAGPTFYGPLGVDITHAHHHARRTSSNATFVAAMAPMDGLSRNVIAGISKRHLGSPYEETLAAWGDGRLGQGKIWITTNTIGGATSPSLIDADGYLVIQTVQQGQGYWLQAVGDSLTSQAFESVR